MRREAAQALKREAVPVLRAKITEDQLRKLFPVSLEPMDPWSTAEPSKGGLVRLKTGRLAVLTYGTATHTLEIALSKGSDSTRGIADVLSEAPINSAAIEWRTDRVSASRKPAVPPIMRAVAKKSHEHRVDIVRDSSFGYGHGAQVVKRDTGTGQFIDHKADHKPFKGVRRESNAKPEFPQRPGGLRKSQRRPNRSRS